jgi:hypothetical protein
MVALEGTIKEFGIADILQLICQQQKSGILIIEHKNRKAEIFLDEGTIAAARPSSRPPEEALGQLLIRAKLVSQENIVRAYDKQKETFGYLGEILIHEGFISGANLEQALLVQIYETLYDVFQWKEGTYQFNPQSSKISMPYAPRLNIQSILLDVLRMIDEWPDVKGSIPSFNTIFEKSPEGRADNLENDALLIYNLVDGNRTTQQIIDEGLLGRFTTCKILSEFIHAGYIKQFITRTAASKASRKRLYPQQLFRFLPFAILIISVLLSIVLPASFPENILPLLYPENIKQSYMQDYRYAKKRSTIDAALAMYRIRRGTYPQQLSDLVKIGIAADRDIILGGGKQLFYVTDGASYSIEIVQKE